jgi:hypothetical protein
VSGGGHVDDGGGPAAAGDPGWLGDDDYAGVAGPGGPVPGPAPAGPGWPPAARWAAGLEYVLGRARRVCGGGGERECWRPRNRHERGDDPTGVS